MESLQTENSVFDMATVKELDDRLKRLEGREVSWKEPRVWLPLVLAIAAIGIAWGTLRSDVSHIGDDVKDLKKLHFALVENLLKKISEQPKTGAPGQTRAAIASAIIASARPTKVPIPRETLTAIGESFLEEAPKQIAAWDVVVELANYTSDVAPWRRMVLDEIGRRGYPWCFSNLPADSGVEVSKDRKTVYTDVRPSRYEYCVMRLDDPQQAKMATALPRGQIFRHCLAKYSGGDVLVPGRYEMSVFEIAPSRPPSAAGLLLASKILRSPEGFDQAR